MKNVLTIIELRAMSIPDLRREVRGKQAMIGALRLTVSLGKEKNTSLLRKEKKELARILTVICEKERVKPLNVSKEKATVRAQS